MAFIVSANYRNRSSPYKWLLRRQDQHPSEAVAYKTVGAAGVTFEFSSDFWETGFGCQRVAVCESATGYDPEPPAAPKVPDGAVRLKFGRYTGFRVEGHDFEVKGLKELHLGEHMHGILKDRDQQRIA